MPTNHFEVKISLNRLLVGLLVALVPICAVGFYTTSRAGEAMDRTIGNHFKTISESTASEISQFIHDRVIAVGTLAATPTITDTCVEANRYYDSASEEAFQARVLKMEKDWNTPAAEPYVRQMLNSRASRLLNRYRELDRRFLRLTLTDSHGAAIAATHKTLDYYQADEEFWQAIYAEGRGAVHITDVLYDEVTKSYYIGLGVPVMEEGTNRFIGALDALIEVSSIFPLVHRIEKGRTMRAALVKADGTIIYSPGVNLATNMKSEEFAAASEAMLTPEGLLRGYMTTTLRNGRPTLIAFSNPGLASSYPNLSWTVLVVQDAREAFAAARGVLRLILFGLFVCIAMVTFLAVYFALHRKPDYTDLATPSGGDAAQSARA